MLGQKNEQMDVHYVNWFAGQGLDLRLAIAGGCRNADDEARAASLQKTVQDLGLQVGHLSCSRPQRCCQV